MQALLFSLLSAASAAPYRSPRGAGIRAAHVARRQRVPPPRCSEVAAFVEGVAAKALADFNVTGIAVGVVCNHTVAFIGGFGFADAASGTKATADTLWQVASNSKAFTSMLALQLAEEGAMDIDAPAAHAMSAWRTSDAYATASITPRDMMSHRTGLPRHDAITFGARSRAAMMEALPYLSFDKQARAQPGEYNNLMLAATGFLEEQVTGETWEALVQTRIFDRLNMTASAPAFSTLRPAQVR